MKKLFYIFIALALVFTACKNNEPEKENGNGNKGQLDPNAMILIRGVEAQTKNMVLGLTPLQVVQEAASIRWQSHYWNNTYREEVYEIVRGFADGQRCFDIPALKMWGIDIIAQNGEFYRDFIYGFDVYVINFSGDTIAHVPNSVIESARVLIREAFEDENYTEVYRLFDEAFIFLPVSKE